MYWFLIDIALVAVIAVSVVTCAKRGLLASLIRLLGIVLALVGASVLSRTFAPRVFDGWFRADLVDAIAAEIAPLVSFDPGSLAEALLSGTAGIIVSVFGGEGQLTDFLAGGVLPADPRAAAERIVDGLVRSAYESMIQIALFIAVFLVFAILIAILSRVLHLANAIPVLGTVNRVFGAFFGVLSGTCLCFLLVAVFAFLFSVIGRSADYNRIVLNNTVLFSLFYRNNPLLRGA